MDMKELEKKETEILKRAKDAGIEDEYLFKTTFERYQTQIRMCDTLKKSYEESDLTVTKEYVKGRENIVINPVITAYNQTAGSANKTAETLMRLIKAADKAKSKKPKKDPLVEVLRG